MISRFLLGVAVFTTFLVLVNLWNENYPLMTLQAGYAGLMLIGADIARSRGK